METEFVLIWAILVTITLGVLMGFVIKLRKRHDSDIKEMEKRISKERKDATDRSRNTLKGTISEQMSPLFPEFYSKSMNSF